uniref:Uncharacterized protein n=1 Tax=Anopheles dirus TaxID=7168 RepID=A0A182NWQ6_9DIPT
MNASSSAHRKNTINRGIYIKRYYSKQHASVATSMSTPSSASKRRKE